MDILGIYRNNLNDSPILPRGEKRELDQLIRSGGKASQKARSRYAQHNLRLALTHAQGYAYKYPWVHSLEDFIGEANLALTSAADSYNPDIARFTTHATSTIKTHLRGVVRRKFIELSRRKDFHESKGWKQELHMPSASLGERIAPDIAAIEKRMARLSDKEKQILDLYVNQGYTLEEIGEQFSITKEAVRKALERAKAKLRGIRETRAEWEPEMQQYLHHLTPRVRQVIELLFIKNLKPQQVSAKMGIGDSAISIQKNKGLAQLQKLMELGCTL